MVSHRDTFDYIQIDSSSPEQSDSQSVDSTDDALPELPVFVETFKAVNNFIVSGRNDSLSY